MHTELFLQKEIHKQKLAPPTFFSSICKCPCEIHDIDILSCQGDGEMMVKVTKGKKIHSNDLHGIFQLFFIFSLAIYINIYILSYK